MVNSTKSFFNQISEESKFCSCAADRMMVELGICCSQLFHMGAIPESLHPEFDVEFSVKNVNN